MFKADLDMTAYMYIVPCLKNVVISKVRKAV